MRRWGSRPGSAALLLAVALVAPASRAAALEARAEDLKGRPVENAVIAAHRVEGDEPVMASPDVQVIDQVDKEFIPGVKAVRVGTPISFPNGDNIRHHVYSFSDAKKFELPLYKGTPTEPVVFDEPGVVVLGCNIHDWMLAYVYVLDTPYFGITGPDGSARLDGLPPGEYHVELMHPRAKGSSADTRVAARVTEGGGEPIVFHIKLKPDFRSRAPRAG